MKAPKRVPTLVRPKPLVVAIRHALRLPLPRAVVLYLPAIYTPAKGRA